MTYSDWKDHHPAFTGLSLVKEHSSVKDHSTVGGRGGGGEI